MYPFNFILALLLINLTITGILKKIIQTKENGHVPHVCRRFTCTPISPHNSFYVLEEGQSL